MMKTKSKALITALCAVLLVIASVLGTMAYLTSTTDEVKNTFTVGNVNITLDEAKANEDGSLVAGAARVTENTYKLLPSHVYAKDPTVHVTAGSEDCYLFVKVDNQISEIEKTGATSIASQMAAKGWQEVTGKGVYVYVGTTEGATTPFAVSAGNDVKVFENLTIDDEVTNTELASYANKTIKITAYAVQKDGFEGKTAADIWDAAFKNA